MLRVAQHVLHTCNLLPMPLQQYVLATPITASPGSDQWLFTAKHRYKHAIKGI